MNAKDSVSSIKGIGKKTEQLFAKIGVFTIEDLLRYFPRCYDLYEPPVPMRDVTEGSVCAVCGMIAAPVRLSGGRGHEITALRLRDATGSIEAVWFHMPFLKASLPRAGTIVLRGRVVRRKDDLILEHPEIFADVSRYEEKLDTLQPVYSLTAGLTNNAVIRAVRAALSEADTLPDLLGEEIARSYGLLPQPEAVKRMHFPENREQVYEGRRRFVFEEFFLFSLSLQQRKGRTAQKKNTFGFTDQPEVERFIEKLPYTLTDAQLRVWHEIRADLLSDTVMARLVQGDVGSGKTIVAFLAVLLCAKNGAQSALMAPTEVLARQHFETVSGLIAQYDLPLTAVFLSGSTKGAQRADVYAQMASGEADVIIGTQALFQQKAVYKNLALVISDEQHRFGVRQREALAGKGNSPHILVMSATPIPRTLSVILYGDLQISVIDELPKNRLRIKNCVVNTDYRPKACRFMRTQVQAGHQCYVICPMVEESENLDAENVVSYSRMLAEKMGPDIRVGCLHGRMKPEEKDAVLEDFGANRIQILVSTTVVEVGIDVPNATVMLIENAERFGLSQLHQLRGRVGRGEAQSYCIFMTASRAKEAKARLEILENSNDGFQIAAEDMRLRGPGDLFGIRQSGFMDFKTADIYQDAQVLTEANEAAKSVLAEDPKLKKTGREALRRYLDEAPEGTLAETI